jgi:hypothetical protein
MKKTLFLAFVPGFLTMACMDTSKMDQTQQAASEAIAAQGQAATNIFLGDMVDSTTTPTTGNKPADDSVKDDTKVDRLAAMAQKMLDRLDADDSGSLSEAEFLVLAKSFDVMKAAKQTDEQLAAKETKLKEIFAKISGADTLLSAEEIPAALKAQSARIGKFRGEKHAGKHKERVKEVTSEVLAKFDLNKDGKLDESEITALRGADKEACKGKGKEKEKEKDKEKEKGEKPEDGSAPEAPTVPAPAAP